MLTISGEPCEGHGVFPDHGESFAPSWLFRLKLNFLAQLKRSLMVSGIHPIAGLRQLKQRDVMTLIYRYPLSQSQQSLLATQAGSAEPLLTENTSVVGKSGSPDESTDLTTGVEDCPNNGIGE
jgi:hypothetical protein